MAGRLPVSGYRQIVMEANRVQTLKPSELVPALAECAKANTPTCIWGHPGVGKSQIAAQVAASLGRKLFDIRAANLDAVDLRGIPYVDGGHPLGHARLPALSRGRAFAYPLG